MLEYLKEYLKTNNLEYTSQYQQIQHHPLFKHEPCDKYHDEIHLELVSMIASSLAILNNIEPIFLDIAGCLHDYNHHGLLNDSKNIEATIRSVSTLSINDTFNLNNYKVKQELKESVTPAYVFQRVCKIIRYSTYTNEYNNLVLEDPEFSIIRDADKIAGLIAYITTDGKLQRKVFKRKEETDKEFYESQILFYNNIKLLNDRSCIFKPLLDKVRYITHERQTELL